MTHYWPISNGQMNDSVGTANMIQGASTTFTSDRFGNPDSALNLNEGWTQVPSGVYLESPQFTVSVWVYPKQVRANARIFEFGNGIAQDSILLGLSVANTLEPFSKVYIGSNKIAEVFPYTFLNNDQWQLLALTYDGTYLKIYINGLVNDQFQVDFTPPTVNRKQNYIGKSADLSVGYSSSYLDDLKFYNICLTTSEINNQFIFGIPLTYSASVLNTNLTHYWPISDGKMTDAVGTAHMTQGADTAFTSDRFGNPDSALNLNGGQTLVPSGIYFNTPQFTITMWVYPLNTFSGAPILSFGNEESSTDSIELFMSPLSCALMAEQSQNFNLALSLTSGIWQFLSLTYDGAYLYLYINGVITGISSLDVSLPIINRTQNKFGDGSSSYLDDLRFYNVALTPSQINDVMSLQ